MGVEYSLIKDVLLVVSYGLSWVLSFDLAHFLEDFDIDIEDLKDDVINEIEHEIDDLTIDELKDIDMDELVINSIDVVIQGKEELNNLPDDKKDEIIDYLYRLITPSDISNIEKEIQEIVEDAELYEKSSWKYHGISPKDFLE